MAASSPELPDGTGVTPVYPHHGQAEGKANPPLASIVHQDRKGQENTEALGWKRIRWGIVLVPLGVPLIVYDCLHDWALFLPAFIGINLIAAGARMIIWGMGTLENSRRSATFVRSRQKPTRRVVR